MKLKKMMFNDKVVNRLCLVSMVVLIWLMGFYIVNTMNGVIENSEGVVTLLMNSDIVMVLFTTNCITAICFFMILHFIGRRDVVLRK